ncbi:MAG: hypothetical protein WCF84_14850 [Anaerolineae bacterium]
MAKVIVFVHGAGKQGPNYAVDPLAEVALRLGYEPLAVPVYYADIANVGSPPGVIAFSFGDEPPLVAEPPAVQQFKMQFAMQVQATMGAQPPMDQVTTLSISPTFIGELVATEANEIAGYLFNPDVYNRIQARMCDGLDKAAQQGDTLVIASHSLGTLVAFDALKAVGDRYKISTFMTMGSPLAIIRRLGLRGPELGAITSKNVGEWLNFYNPPDPVSNVVGPYFPIPGYRPRDVYVTVASLPPASHDYLRNAECLQAIADAVK